MSDTPIKRSTRRTTSVRRTVETTTRRTSISIPTGNTSVNIATAFKLSGISESTIDPEDSSRNSHASVDTTPVPIRGQEETVTEEDLSDKNTATDSEEEDHFETPQSTGLGRRLLASILPKSPRWIRASTPQSTGSESQSESESDSDGQTSETLQTKKTRSTGLRRIPEPPNTVNLVAGRYYLRPRVNSPARSAARVPAQLQEHSLSSSDDEEWNPKLALYESTAESKAGVSRKLENDFHEDSEEPSSDEYSYSESGSDSDSDYPEVIKVPIWRPIQAAIVGCLAGIGQVVKSILSAVGFLIFMVFWILKEIVSTLYSYTKYTLLTLFVTPVRSLITSERTQELIVLGARGTRALFRYLTKYLGLVLILSAMAGVLWTNMANHQHDDLFNNLRENLDYHKYLEKLPTDKWKLPDVSLPAVSLPDISLPDISLPEISIPSFKPSLPSLPSLPSFDFKLPSWPLWLENRHKPSDDGADSPTSIHKAPKQPKESDLKVSAPSSGNSDIAAESFDELLSRLESAEVSLRHLSFVANSLVDHNEDLREAANNEVAYQENLNKEVNFLKSLLNTHAKKSQDQKQTVDSILGAMKENDHKLEEFNNNIELLRKLMNSAESKMNNLDAGIADVYNDLEKVKERVTQISQLDYYSHQILDTVERTLPKYLVASKNTETGSIEIAPEFYHYLNSLFVTPAKLQSIVQENLVRSDQPDLPPWLEFLETNQNELHSLIRTNIAESVKSMSDSGTIVSKQDFIHILQAKLEGLKKEVTSTIQEEINSVAHKFEKKIQENSESDSHTLTENPDTISLVNQLIDSALAKYSADMLGLPDFALYSGGGRVIPSLTSASYHVPSKSFAGRLMGKVFGLSALGSGNPPTTALMPDIHLGRCWPFPGDQGNLTILLSRSIIPTDFSIEHVPRSIAIDVRSAPKKLAVYGLYEKSDDNDEISGEILEHEGKLYVQHFLSTYEYDVYNPRHVQTFSVQTHTKLTKPVRIIQLRVLNNYGQDTYTCLYRFRVHGRIPE